MLAPQSSNFPTNEFAYYPIEPLAGNGFTPPGIMPQLHPCQLQPCQPLQLQLEPIPLSLNTFPYTSHVQQIQTQFVPFLPPPYYVLIQQPFCPQPPPSQELQSQFTPFIPSPSPPRQTYQDVTQIHRLSLPSLACDSSVSLGGAGSQTSDVNSELRKFYSFDVAAQKVSIGEMDSFEQGLVRAMRNTLQLPSTQFVVRIIPAETKKNFTIQWMLNEEKFDHANVKHRSTRQDFQKKLICELAKIDDGRFNKHLSGAKQLTIINEGWACLFLLQEVLISPNGTLRRLLDVRPEDRFEDEAMTNLYKVSADEGGKALRGPTVVGIRFKQQPDIIKMPTFVEEVKASMTIKRATMIASLKTQKQYKGWSVYLDVGTVENVQRVEEISQKYGFEKAKIFVAEDNYNHSNE